MFYQTDFLIFVDHVKRELEYCNRVANHLRRKGYRVVVLSVNFDLHKLIFLRPKVVLIPHSLGLDELPLKLFHLKGSQQVIHLDWEQDLFPAFLKYKKHRSEAELTALFRCSWSAEYGEKLRLDGVPSSQVLFSPRPSLLMLEDRRYQGPRKRSVDYFFPMNLTAAFLDRKQINARIELGMDRELYSYYVSMSEEYLRCFVEGVAKLWLASNGTKSILIRPHPLENEGVYRDGIQNALGMAALPTNIVISQQDTVWDQLNEARLVCTSWSTVASDAVREGIPTYLFRPFTVREEFHIPCLTGIPQVARLEDLQDKVGRETLPRSRPAVDHVDLYSEFEKFVLSVEKVYANANMNSLRLNISPSSLILIMKRLILKQLVRLRVCRQERYVDLF